MENGTRPHILVLGDLAGLGPSFGWLAARWDLTLAASAADALRRLRDATLPDLLLMIPGDDLDACLELCRAVKFDRRTSFVPIAAVRVPEDEPRVRDVLEAGVDEYLPAWVAAGEIDLRLSRCVRLKRATDSLEDAETVIKALAAAIEGKDECTCGHVERVSTYCVEIGRRVGVGEECLMALRTGGVVHDIGKIGVPDAILTKPGKLTEAEMAIVRRHPVIGYDILAPLRTFRAVLPIVRWHHERPNGTGYPDGLKGDALPLLPRIAAVADVFDALSTDRPYRAALPMERCREIMLADGDKGNLDAALVAVLFDVVGAAPAYAAV